MKVGNRNIGSGFPCFIIAEIGNNHNGDMNQARRLIDEAVSAGADAVKFQLRNMDSLYGEGYKSRRSSADLGTQYTLDLLEKVNLDKDQMNELFNYAHGLGVISFCTPWDSGSVEDLMIIGNPLYKIASADMTNHPLIRKIVQAGKPIICSTGMSNDKEISETVALLKSLEADFALLHCNSTYPAPFKDINLKYIDRLKKFNSIVGYSGHERGFHIPIAAVALGAQIIEKHFTLDRTLEGVDHRVSLLPKEFRDMVCSIRELESALGSEAIPRTISQGEMMNRENLGKSIVSKRLIEIGERITEDMLEVRSPGLGLQPNRIGELVGFPAKRRLLEGDLFFATDLSSNERTCYRYYKFERPWGIPVRYHDFENFTKIANPDFVEFHLSYGDMEENPSRFINSIRKNMGFTVHAPELFANDHIVDLCSKNDEYLEQSIENMKNVIDVTLNLRKYFPSQHRPFIVATIGGFTVDRPLDKSERMERYKEIIKNLRKIEHDCVEILPQSAAPFPWHMGGQQYQNLFLHPDEIDWFCKEYGYRICLDISHSFLACNHLGYDPEYFFRTVAPHTAHLHLGDCRGVDGEGLQIGEGVIDFELLGRIFKEHCPNASFIPEIWQGHKNSGEAFWIACERLEGFL